MSRTTALILTIAVTMLLVAAACIGFTALGVAEGLLTATVLAIAALGSHAVSRVVMHYPPPDERRR